MQKSPQLDFDKYSYVGIRPRSSSAQTGGKSMSEVKRRRGRPRKCPPRTPECRINNGNSGHDWRKPFEEISYWTDLPEFFQIYMPALCLNALRIPSDFLKKFGEKIPTSVTLRVLSGLCWPVHIHKVCDKWFFQKGWKEFVEENSIEDGDFMTFCYVGNSVFSVSVFGRNGCRKGDANVIDVSLDESVEDTEKSESESDDHTADTVKRGIPLRSNTVCSNPSFSVAIKEYHRFQMCLTVPLAFLRDHLTKIVKERVKRGTEMAFATLWYKKKSWEVGLLMSNANNRISRGWSKFANDNSVRTGDLCCFELIDAVNLSFNVSISRQGESS